MTLTVVTPWLDHLELVDDYLAALAAGPPPDERLIVDNGSTPPLPFADLRLDRNQGFSAACNHGLRAAATDAVLFLNNDVAVDDAGWLDVIRAALEPGVLVGVSLRSDVHANVDGQPFPYLDGWCLAGMRDDLLALGGFDESFDEPAYYSDNDLCFRARAAGMRLREVRVGLRHKENVTAGHGPDVAAAMAANYQRYAARVRGLVAA